jgi:AraC-like DNA-binding protein
MRTIETIVATIGHIETHLDGPLALGGVARKLGYSRYHLHRLFTKTVGLPMHVYIQRRRLTEAAKLLVRSELPILEIALQSGYESQQAFAMAFKAMYKLPPGRFRRNSEFYPLQMRFEFDASALEAHSMARHPVARPIMTARAADAAAWMRLVRLVIDGFPCLDEAEHAATLQRYITRRCAFIMKEGAVAIGIMMISPHAGSIDFLGVHPFFRNSGIMQALIGKAMEEMAGHPAVCITTYRRGDRADTGHRKALKAFGFSGGELLVEFGYPTQKMFIPTDHDCRSRQ